ncbi:D-2-hydroxyacid dehydrogenase [Chloroflexota bacterium]
MINERRAFAAMESVNVLVTSAIGDECLQQISSVSPKIKPTNASSLFRAEQSGDLTSKEKLGALLAEAEVIFGLRLPKNVITRAPKMKWIQVLSAGVNRFLDAEMVESPVIMTNVSGIHAIPISEFVLEQMLMFVKLAPLCFQMKQEKRWERPPPSMLRSKTVGVVGLGSIGREVARLSKAFGMRVVATRRSAKRGGRARYVDMLLPRDQLQQLLGESDFVVLALPLTPETKKLIGEEELRNMKPTAHLINIARGEIVDEEALIRALEEHRIAGAGLDVFATEPLPPDSRLWELPNVIFSPHISGGQEDYAVRGTEVFCENLRRYLSGKKLLNVVDKKKGY